MTTALCFVLMPAGRKVTGNGTVVDYDRVYDELFAPAIRAAGLEPFRADGEQFAGPVRLPALERLVLCPYAIVDVTLASENLYYQLGARDAARPSRTVIAFADGHAPCALDIAGPRALPYSIASDGAPAQASIDRARISEGLIRVCGHAFEIPLFELVDNYSGIGHDKVDVFARVVPMPERYRSEIARLMALPEGEAVSALREYERRLGTLANVESAVVVAQFLAYREVKAYADMIRLFEAMPRPLAHAVLVREQHAFALNRIGHGVEAEAMLKELLAETRPSSELYSLLGRVYKDRYDAAREAGDEALADASLELAADAYLKGFELDWRDDYPGTNAVTLMAIRDRGDPRVSELLPVVRYAARRRVAQGDAGYWSHAALVELAVIADDEGEARLALSEALAENPKAWMRETTLQNLRLLRNAGFAPDWLNAIERRLQV